MSRDSLLLKLNTYRNIVAALDNLLVQLTSDRESRPLNDVVEVWRETFLEKSDRLFLELGLGVEE